MALPVVPLGTGAVKIGTEMVEYHAMSRAQALKMNALRGREDEAEVLILMSGTGCSEEDAKAFRESNDTDTAGILIDAILDILGLTDNPKT